MEPIRQEDVLGCAVACVAFVLKINYGNSIKLFKNGKRKARNKGFYCKEVVAALEIKGLMYEYKYVKNKRRRKIYKSNTIVYVRKSKKYPLGHYLVRFNNKWMDSWINFPDKDIETGFRKRLPERPIYAIYPKMA
jgi:hypothetical protein